MEQPTAEDIQRRVKESLARQERAFAKRRKQARRRLGKDRTAAKVPPEKRLEVSRAKAKKAKRARRANR